MDGKIITQSRPNGSTVRNNDSVTITIGRLVESKDDDTTTTEQEENDGNKNPSNPQGGTGQND